MPVRAALWAARAAQCGRGLWERGRGKEGGREEAGRGVWMLVRQRRPACSQLLPECERRRESEGGGGGGGRSGADSLVTRLANSKAELVSPSRRVNTHTPNPEPRSQ